MPIPREIYELIHKLSGKGAAQAPSSGWSQADQWMPSDAQFEQGFSSSSNPNPFASRNTSSLRDIGYDPATELPLGQVPQQGKHNFRAGLAALLGLDLGAAGAALPELMGAAAPSMFGAGEAGAGL